MKICKNDVSLPEKLGEYVVNMSPEESGELRVLVYILAKEGETEASEIAEKLGMDETDVISAVSFWRGMGLVNAGKKGTSKPAASKKQEKKSLLPSSVRDTDTRTYTGEEIASILQKKPEVASLLDFAQSRLEKVFSPSDVAKLVYLEDYILMTPPMIMKIIDYCVDMDKKSMRYVEKTALSIYDEGVENYAALEEYFEKKKKSKSEEGIVRSIMGIGERNFTAAEKVHISKWFGEYSSSEELITLAYEKTIASISKPSVPYMSKLLQRWHENGYKTSADVANGSSAANKSKNIDLAAFDEAIPAKKQNTENLPGLNLDDFFEN